MQFIKLTFIFIFLSFSYVSFSQDKNKIDSLLQLLDKSQHDTSKIEIYKHLIYQYSFYDSAKTADYYNQLKPIAEKYQKYDAIVNAACNYAWILMKMEYYEKSDKLYGQALNLAENKNIKTELKNVYNGLGNLKQATGEIDLAINCIKKYLELSIELNDSVDIATAYYNLGIYHTSKGELNKGIDYYQKCINADINRKHFEGYVYNNLGFIYRRKGDYTKAHKYYLLALKINEAKNNNQQKAKILSNIADIYYYHKNYDIALEKFLKVLDIYKQLEDENGMARVYYDIAYIYLDQDKYNRANTFFNKSCDIYKKYKNKRNLANVIYGFGELYLEQLIPDTALIYLNHALDIFEIVKDKSSISKTNLLLGKTYFITMDYEKAINHLNLSKIIANEIGEVIQVRDASELLSTIYNKKHDYKLAYENHVLFKTLSDSIMNEQNIKKHTELSMQYNFEKEKAEINNQNEKNKIIQENKLNRQKYLTWLGITGFASMLILSFVFFRNFRSRKKINQVLERQNEEINQQKAEYQLTSELLEANSMQMEKLSLVAQKTHNSVIIANADGNITWVNPAFTRMYGYSKRDFIKNIGKHISKTTTYEGIEQLINDCIANKKSENYESFHINKTGEEVWTQATLTPIFKNEVLDKILIVESNITMLKLAENEIIKQAEELETQNENITLSITYAESIQKAILAPEASISHYLDSYIIYLPKDIVSGDIYWFKHFRRENLSIASAIDCTGHGVPAAFLSLIVHSLLRVIIIERNTYQPAEILNQLKKEVIKTLNQIEGKNRDGLDLILCSIKPIVNNRFQIKYAGAKTPFLYYNSFDNEVIRIKTDRKSIGGIFNTGENFKYTQKEITLSQNDMIYLISDGIIDQPNKERKRFGTTKLLDLLKSTARDNLINQRSKIYKAIQAYKSETLQRDDITFWGIKL